MAAATGTHQHGGGLIRWSAVSAAAAILMFVGCSGKSEQGNRTSIQSRTHATRATASEPIGEGDRHSGGDISSARYSAANVAVPEEGPAIDAGLMSLDPREDGWLSEHFNHLAAQRLKELGKLIEDRAYLDTAHAGALVEASFSAGDLVPSTTLVRHDDSFRVARATDPPDVDKAMLSDRQHDGPDGMVEALAKLTDHYRPNARLHAKFKVIRVQLSDGEVRTVQLVHVSGETATGYSEQNSTWVADWRWDNVEALPTLKRLAVTDYERADVVGPPIFADCTVAAFAREQDLFQMQLLIGIGSWVRRLEAHFGTLQTGMSGIAVGDVNGDGMDDVYVCQTGGLPNRLLIHQPDGTVRETAEPAGVDVLDHTHAALLIDLDNDGDQDLILALSKELLLFANTGTGSFRLVGGVGGVFHPHSLAAADFDRDGDLDIYACGYFPDGSVADELPVPSPIYNARNGGRNVLLRNDGNMRLVDVTADVGLDEDNSRYSYAVVWEDYDQDGDDDLYVVNDFGDNNLYRNDAGAFVEVTEEAGLSEGTFGMSAAAGDYNRDGWIDFYKANMFSSAGNRVTTQDQFMQGMTESHRSRMFHLARGNSLLRNVGGRFEDVSLESGTTMGRWSWGSLFIDIDNDGWEDLFVANGYITGEQIDDL